MARLSSEEAEAVRRIFEKNDEELGRWLAEGTRQELEAMSRRKAGVTEAWSGVNALMEPPRHKLARRIMELLTDGHLDAAVNFESDAPSWLAKWLALRGDYARAGRAYRKGSWHESLVTHRKREAGHAKMMGTKVAQQVKRVTAWSKIGHKIRETEHGCRMNNTALAREIADQTGDKINSIRLELPKLGLDRKSLPMRKPVKSILRKKSRKKSRNFATLKR